MSAGDDIRAIELLQRLYAQLNDGADWHAVAELFTEDARFARPSTPEQPIVGRDAILRSLLARPRAAGRRHLVANPEVELLDAHTARATCHSILLVEHRDGSGTVSVGGFRDQLRRAEAGWRFTARLGFTHFDPVPFTAARHHEGSTRS